jgi:type III secretion protein R
MVIILGALALAPFALMMLTSFLKISVVLSILRNAMGTQQVPPNPVITGLALILTIFVMVPVVRQMYAAAGNVQNTRDIFSEASVRSLFEASQKGKEPLRKFLSRHSHAQDRILFMELAARMERGVAQQGTAQPNQQAPTQQAVPQEGAAQQPATQEAVAQPGANRQAANQQTTAQPGATPPTVNQQAGPPIDKEDFQILIPSFATSQLKEAFQIGFLVFIPFIIIDMVVANILLAMGMQMLSPVVISLPFKLLLFVLTDGWYMVVRGLVLSYV